MKIAVVLGTRPEAVKLAPLVHEARARPGVDLRLWLTGQHREMVAQVTEFFGLEADADLDIMSPDQTLSDVAARTLAGLVPLLRAFRPDWLVVQGDTTTAFAAGLAAFYAKVKVAHVEAGLRSGDLQAPFPEEANRVLLGRIADLHLAPTPAAAAALRGEGVPAGAIEVVGNTVVDALHLGLERLDRDGLPPAQAALLPPLDHDRPLLLVTGHRRESFGQPFRDVCEALRTLAETERVEIVYPVHLNPNVRGPVFELLAGAPNVHLLDPVPYPVLLWLMQRCHFVLTDSGGIQEEAASIGKPVLVLRDVTERRESVDAGVSVLVGTDRARILEEARALLHDEGHHARMSRPIELYGDGRASERICDRLGMAPRHEGAFLPPWSAALEDGEAEPVDRVADLERRLADKELELEQVLKSKGWRALEAFRRVRQRVVRGPVRALVDAVRSGGHGALVRVRSIAYSPYDRLTCLKPIPVDVWDDARLASPAGGARPFTLVATTYQEAAGVERWVASVRDQTRRPDEIVVVDGGSTDGTPDRVEAAAAAAGLPVRVLRSPSRVNIAAGRNRAIREAAHELVVCSDFGCRLDPEYLERIVAPFRDPEVDLAAGLYDADGPALPGVTEWFVPTSADAVDPATFLPSARAVAFRRSVWEKAGGYPEWLTLTGEDTLFDLNARKVSRRWAFVPGAKVSWAAPATLREALALARRYGAGDGEAGLEGLWDTYRKNRAYRRAQPLWLWAAALGAFGSAALRASGRHALVAVARQRGYEEGQARRIARLEAAGRIRGSALVVSGVPFYDSGGGQRGTQLALELIRQGRETTFVNVYPSFERRDPIYLETDFELLSLAGLDDFDVERWIETRRATLAGAVAIFEFPHPRFVPLARRLKREGVRVVYDCIDEWKGALGWTWYSADVEREFVRLADVRTASARVLVERLQAMGGRDVHYLPQGVNVGAFRAGVDRAPPADLPRGRGPLFVYVGSLWGSWFDWDLLRAAADALPDARFVLVGEYRGQCPFRRRNVTFVGLKPHAEIAAYLAAADACLIPFKVDDITRAVNPLKVYEYLAMGRPVVATPLPELHGMPHVHLAADPAAFAAELRRAAASSVDGDALATFIRESGWDRRVRDLLTWSGLEPAASDEPGAAEAPAARTLG